MIRYLYKCSTPNCKFQRAYSIKPPGNCYAHCRNCGKITRHLYFGLEEVKRFDDPMGLFDRIDLYPRLSLDIETPMLYSDKRIKFVEDGIKRSEEEIKETQDQIVYHTYHLNHQREKQQILNVTHSNLIAEKERLLKLQEEVRPKRNDWSKLTQEHWDNHEWESTDGRVQKIGNMATPHIKNCIEVLTNHFGDLMSPKFHPNSKMHLAHSYINAFRGILILRGEKV